LSKYLCVGLVCLLMLVVLWAPPASAQSSETKARPDGAEAPDQGNVSILAGPSSVGGQLDKDREAKGASDPVPRLSERYFSFKNRVEEEYGFSFGFDYNALFQAASDSLGEDTAAGGVFRAYGQWTLVGKDSENTGTLTYKVENRHRLGTDIAPRGLGSEIGYAGLTAVTFSSIGWVLTNLYWSQHLLNNRLAFVGGIVDVTDYVDVYGLVNPWTDFNNYAFITNPTIPAPDQGLGAAVRVMPTENIYIVAGIADANGDPTNPGDSINSFFSEDEFFTHIEVGWISSWERRFSDNIHLTIWHADERNQAKVPNGWGVAFSFSRLFADTWEPFFRAGYSEDGGALWERSVSAGFGYYPGKKGDVLGVGFNWSRPAEDVFGPGLDDQYTAEIYYRLQVLKVLTVTPDVQLIINPALNPQESSIWVFGLRARLAL
jgi:porin